MAQGEGWSGHMCGETNTQMDGRTDRQTQKHTHDRTHTHINDFPVPLTLSPPCGLITYTQKKTYTQFL